MIMLNLQKQSFREKYPDGKLKTSVVPLYEQYILVEARVYQDKNDAEECFTSNAVAVCRLTDTGDPVDSALSSAICNALTDAGFGGNEEPTIEEPVVTETKPAAEQPSPFAPPPVDPKVADLPFIPETPAQSYSMLMPVDEIVGLMTVDDAKRVVVDCGAFKNRTLAEVAVEKPASLTWYVSSYSGPNNILRAGAKKLLIASDALEAKAS